MSGVISPFASGGGLQPYQLQPETYGAIADGKVLGDVSITSGTGIASSVSYSFQGSDIGKGMVINGGLGTAAAPLIAVINGVVSGNATLSVSATANVTSGSAFFGTDNGPAFLKFAQALQSYALANNYQAQGKFKDALYGASTLYQTTTGPGNYNTHLPILPPAANGTSRQLQISLYGAGNQGNTQYFQSTMPCLQGTCIVSMSQAPGTANATFGQQSIIGGPTGGGAFGGGFANIHVTTEGIMVVSPQIPNQIGFDFAYCAGWSWKEISAQVLASVQGNLPQLNTALLTNAAFLSSIGIGFRAPLIGNNDAITGVRKAIQGYETMGWTQDHYTCFGLASVYCDGNLVVDFSHGISNLSHAVSIKNWSCENYNGLINASNGSGSSYCRVDIEVDTEPVGGGDPAYDVNDPNNTLFGTVKICDAKGRTNRRPVVTGASNLVVVNDMMGRGQWTGAVTPGPPAVAASGTAVTNNGRDSNVIITTPAGVTVSAIAIDGVATGLTMAASSVLQTPVIPFGHTITLTYAGGTPTWTWWRV